MIVAVVIYILRSGTAQCAAVGTDSATLWFCIARQPHLDGWGLMVERSAGGEEDRETVEAMLSQFREAEDLLRERCLQLAFKDTDDKGERIKRQAVEVRFQSLRSAQLALVADGTDSACTWLLAFRSGRSWGSQRSAAS